MNKKGFIYILVIYGTQALNIILNILLIRFLTLEQLGTVTLAKVYFQFMDYTHIGMRMAIDRLTPTQNTKENEITINISFFITLFVSIVYILFVYLFISDDLIILLFMFAGLFFALGNIFKAYYRAKQHFKKMFLMSIILALIPLIGQLIGLLLYGYTGFIYSTFFLYMVVFFIYIKYFNLLSYTKFNGIKYKVKSMFNIGGVLFISSLISFITFSIDKFLLEHFEGKETLGEYAIILFSFSMFLIIPSSLAELLFPKIIKNIENKITTKTFKYILYLFIPTFLFISSANIGMDYFIEKLTPEYIPLLQNLHLISWSVLIFAITPIYYHLLNAYNERVKIIKSNLYTLIVFLTYLLYTFNSDRDIIFLLILGKYVLGFSLLILYMYYTYQVKKSLL